MDVLSSQSLFGLNLKNLQERDCSHAAVGWWGEPKFSCQNENGCFTFQLHSDRHISTFLAKAFLSFQLLIECKYCSDAFD